MFYIFYSCLFECETKLNSYTCRKKGGYGGYGLSQTALRSQEKRNHLVNAGGYQVVTRHTTEVHMTGNDRFELARTRQALPEGAGALRDRPEHLQGVFPEARHRRPGEARKSAGAQQLSLMGARRGDSPEYPPPCTKTLINKAPCKSKAQNLYIIIADIKA